MVPRHPPPHRPPQRQNPGFPQIDDGLQRLERQREVLRGGTERRQKITAHRLVYDTYKYVFLFQVFNY